MIRTIISLVLISLANSALAKDIDRPSIGTKVNGLEFKDIRFLTRSLDEFGSKKAIVIVAVSPTCPIAQRYLPVLGAMEKNYRPRGVQFAALYVGDDSIREMAADAIESGVEFPFLRDINHKCTSALGFTRTPEVVVLDADHTIRYRGRIDDQFRLGGDRAEATQHPLRDAIENVLAGKPVTLTETPVDGCAITREEKSPGTVSPTYAEHIAPLIQKHCQDCHHRGTETPFPLLTYRDVASRAEMIAEVVDDRRMPPWYGSDRHGHFINKRELSESERETIIEWARAGAAKGDMNKAPKPREFSTARWHIGEPDIVTTMPISHQVPATGFVDYKYTIFPHIFTRDTWVQAIEILPDNPRVVHHANLAFVKFGERPSEDNFITGRVPGGDAMKLDSGVAFMIPKGCVLALQIHYTTTGKPETSKISVGLRFPREVVHKQLYHSRVDTGRFKITPFSPAFPVIASRKLAFDATGVGLFTHMHVRGKDILFAAKRPDGNTEKLLLIPNYSFDWQQSYRWEPGKMKFPKGTTFEVVAHFDNSEFNPFNPDPKATVGWGDQTTSEMMIGFYFYTRDDEDLNLQIDLKTGAPIAKPTSKG